jgi:hypothetical protein
MTIRQQGGIFGRNPTLNNVTVDGTLTVDQIVEKTGAAGITLDGVTLKDGNVVLADGKGIDFSATAGTGTSELFDDYEEGTWTPTFGNLTLGDGTSTGAYTKIGDTVTIYGKLVLGSTTTVDGILSVTNLPFSASSSFSPSGLMRLLDQGTASYLGMISISPNSIGIRNAVASTATLSSGGVNATNPFMWTATDQIEFNAVYKAA